MAAYYKPCHPPGAVVQVGPQTVDGVTYAPGEQYQQNLPNAPFALKGPNQEDLPLNLVTRDLWHVFYQNQMQINDGKNDQFVAWGDSGGLPMGYYAQSQYSLRLWDVAREFVLCDNFFEGAFGGSFLNHQYLVSATVPFYPNAGTSVAEGQIAVLQGDDPTGTRLKPLAKSPASAMTGARSSAPARSHPTVLPLTQWPHRTGRPGSATPSARTTPNPTCRAYWCHKAMSILATN